MSNLIEQIREEAISQTFSLATISNKWSNRKAFFSSKLPSIGAVTNKSVIQIGEHLSDAFRLNDSGVRTQTGVSAAGNVWEGVLQWYLNVCLAGTKAICVRAGKFAPSAISDCLSIIYQGTILRSEPDLLIISLEELKNAPRERSRSGAIRKLNQIVSDNFNKVGVINIQCKTTWNDNAQVPMLYNMLYNQARKGATIPNGFTIGTKGHFLLNLGHFGYAFATVPTCSDAKLAKFKNTSTHVLRVKPLSAGYYWGRPTTPIASCISELFSFFSHNSMVFPNVATVGQFAADALNLGASSEFDIQKLHFPTII